MTQGAQARRLAVWKTGTLVANALPRIDSAEPAWLPIKDASKDGKPFLLLDKWALETFGIPVIGHWEHDDKYAAGGRWVTTQGAPYTLRPTHYHPIPKIPKFPLRERKV